MRNKPLYIGRRDLVTVAVAIDGESRKVCIVNGELSAFDLYISNARSFI